MIRPFTFLCMVAALGSGLYLYQCKHQAQMLDREIAQTIRDTEATRNRIGLLRAEWSQLNQPDRVSDLARAHTTLITAKPTQFVSVSDLAAKLPAPLAPTPRPQPTDLSEDAPATATTEPTPAAAAAPPQASAPSRLQATPDSHAPDPHAPDPHVADASAPDQAPVRNADPRRAEPRPAAVRQATRTPAAVPTPTHVAAVSPPPHVLSLPTHPATSAAAPPAGNDPTAPGTVGASVLRTMRAHEPQAAPAYVQPIAVPAYVQPAYSTTPVYAPPTSMPAASVLGGSRGTLPPPVPFAAR